MKVFKNGTRIGEKVKYIDYFLKPFRRFSHPSLVRETIYFERCDRILRKNTETMCRGQLITYVKQEGQSIFIERQCDGGCCEITDNPIVSEAVERLGRSTDAKRRKKH